MITYASPGGPPGAGLGMPRPASCSAVPSGMPRGMRTVTVSCRTAWPLPPQSGQGPGRGIETVCFPPVSTCRSETARSTRGSAPRCGPPRRAEQPLEQVPEPGRGRAEDVAEVDAAPQVFRAGSGQPGEPMGVVAGALGRVG